MRSRLAAVVLGIPFGFTIAWSGMNDPAVIRRMMLLESFCLYKVFALAVTVGLVGSLLLRRLRPRHSSRGSESAGSWHGQSAGTLSAA